MKGFSGTYLDHNATTPLKPEVRDSMLEILDFPGNASATHRAGREARRLVEAARAQVSALVNAGPEAVVVFTSGATEANNLALKGAGCERVLVSAIEHPSVLGAAAGSEIIPVTPDGVVDMAALDRMLAGTDRSTLVSVMYINNETGVIQPINEVVALARRHGALVHCDAAQAMGKISIDIQDVKSDFLSLSSHKAGGPQGAGALVMSHCLRVSPQMSGGGQEKNMRAGTENLAAIAGFGKAAELSARDLPRFRELAAWRDMIEKRLEESDSSICFIGKNVSRATNTSMFAWTGAPAETQLIALDLAGVCVSNGSACSSGTVKGSHVLKAMGVPEDIAASALRVSLGWNTTEKDVNCFLSEWTRMHDRIRKINHA